MRRTVSLILFFLFSQIASAQVVGKGNLIQNPGFESLDVNSLAIGWKSGHVSMGNYEIVETTEPGMKWSLNPSRPVFNHALSPIQRVMNLLYWRIEVEEQIGKKVLKLENKVGASPVVRGAWQEIKIDPPRPGPFLITAKVMGSSISSQESSMANLYMEIWVKGEREPFWGPPWEMNNNHGTFSWRLIGFNTGTLPYPYNQRDVEKIVVAPILNASGAFFVDDISVEEYSLAPTAENPVPQGMVSLIADDAVSTQYTSRVFPFGFPVSTAVITGEVARGNPYYMNSAQLKESSWETLSHGDTHQGLATINANEAIGELKRSKIWLEMNGFPAEHFVLPYGEYNAEVLDLVRRVGYKSVRKAYPAAINPPGTFPWDVRAVEIKSTTSFSEIQRLVNEAAAKKWWLILYFHEVENSCGENEYCINPIILQKLVSFLATQPVKVVTYGEGFKMFAAR